MLKKEQDTLFNRSASCMSVNIVLFACLRKCEPSVSFFFIYVTASSAKKQCNKIYQKKSVSKEKT